MDNEQKRAERLHEIQKNSPLSAGTATPPQQKPVPATQKQTGSRLHRAWSIIKKLCRAIAVALKDDE